MRKFITVFCLLATAGLVCISNGNGQDGLELRARPIPLYNCTIKPLREQHAPARVSGVIAEVRVKEGDRVKAGDVLAVIDDRIARLDLEAKQLEAKNPAILGDATARADEALAAYEDTKRLYDKRVAAKEDLRLKAAQLKVAEQGVINAQVKHNLTMIDEKRAEAELERHQIVSEVDGVVILQVRQVGEAVQALDPIFHVIRTDKVRIQGNLHIRYKGRVREGMVIDVYPNLAEDDLLTFQHTSVVRDVKLLPGDKLAASACDDGMIYLWDIVDVGQYGVLTAHDGAVSCLATNDKAPTLLVSGGEDGRIKVWNIAEQSLMKDIPTQGGRVRAIVLSPLNASLCFAGHDDRSIRIYDLQKGTMVATLPAGHTNYVTSLVVTNDGKYLLSAGNDQTVRLWDIDARKEIQSFAGRTNGVSQLGISPSNDAFLFNSESLLQIRSLPQGRPIASFESLSGSFSGVALFSPVPGLVITANDSNQLQLRQQAHNGLLPRLVRTYEGHVTQITGVDIAKDGSFFVSASEDRTVRVWSIPSIDQIEKERTRGVVSFMSPHGDAGSESVTVHAEVENAENVLTTGSFATMVIYPGLKQEVPAIGRLNAIPTD